MTLKINTNIAALNAHRSMVSNDTALSESLERLSTGLRINKAADDSSGMAIADSLKAQSLGIGQAVRNANDGISMVQTADGALQESINIVNTIKTKAIQAASDGQTTDTRRAIQNDIDKLLEELDAIAKTTSYNGQKLLSGAFSDKVIQIGAFANETASISIGSAESNSIGHISQANLSLSSDSGGEVQLTITSSITGEELTLSTIDIQYNNDRDNGMGALEDEINKYTSVTGISANAIVETTTTTEIQAGSTGDSFAINGVSIGDIQVEANDADGALVTAINDKSSETGVEAYISSDGSLTLSSLDGRAIEVDGSVSGVFGSTAGQMSTIGYLQLTQSGVSQFQINGIGAGAVGGDIQIDADMTTVEDSILAAGSTIEAGSVLAAGTIVGGDAIVESSVSRTQLDYEIMAGSTLYATTEIAKGSVIGGSVTVAGSTFASAGTGVTVLEQDMLVTAGSTLDKYTTLGKGTIVTTQFTTSSSGSVVTYNVGDVLASSVVLSRDITLAKDMTLTYNSTATDNTKIKAGSILTNGSQLGATFEIGAIYNATDGAGTTAIDGTTTTNIMLNNTLSTTDNSFTIQSGSLLTENTTLVLVTTGGSTTYSGPTLITTSGVIVSGDTITEDAVYTLSEDQILSEDFTTAATGTFSLATGSILTAGFENGSTAIASTGGCTVTLSNATMADDMTLESGSELAAGSKLIAGSTLGDSTYVMGGELNDTATALETYKLTQLEAGSTLESGSIIAEGSTIGGSITLSGDEILDSDMTATAGSILAAGTILKAGTVISQDMVLNSDSGLGSATEVEVQAGDVLTSDLYVNANTTLSEDMMIEEGSTIKGGSILAVNTANAGTVGLSEVESYNLADLSVLDSESAQRAISIAEAALAALDETRASLGSVQNQLSSTISNLSVTKTNILASESTIRDIDFAEESMTFSNLSLLAQTGSYALAQANATAENIMSLLQ